jgi:hypothetical protein
MPLFFVILCFLLTEKGEDLVGLKKVKPGADIFFVNSGYFLAIQNPYRRWQKRAFSGCLIIAACIRGTRHKKYSRRVSFNPWRVYETY